MTLLTGDWVEEDERFAAFLRSVEADEVHSTEVVMLKPIEVNDDSAHARLRECLVAGEPWAHVVYSDRETGRAWALAQPVSAGHRSRDDAVPFTMVEIHSRLIAWWLTCAWRTRELAAAARSAAQAGQALTAATLVRPLLETAAATWDDGRALRAAWATVKAKGPLTDPLQIMSAWRDLAQTLDEVQFGGKFSDPDAQATYGRVQRKNVMTSLGHLTKASDPAVQSSYQWLCNTVHPSLGNSYVFGFNARMHASQTHFFREFSDQASATPEALARTEPVVQAATQFAAAAALRVIRESLDAALRFIDDLALTSQASTLAPFSYWRAVRAGDRNDPCPCRSGRQAKRCQHEWGGPLADFPDRFALPNSNRRRLAVSDADNGVDVDHRDLWNLNKLYSVPALPPDAAARFRSNARTLAEQHGLVWNEADMSHRDVEYDLHDGEFTSPTLRTDLDYYVALHEIGHKALGLSSYSDDTDESTVDMGNELEVWRWAREHAKAAPTSECWAACMNLFYTHGAPTRARTNDMRALGQ